MSGRRVRPTGSPSGAPPTPDAHVVTYGCGVPPPEVHVRRGSVATADGSIYYELIGQPDDTRPVVVLTHGAGGSHGVWYQQVPLLADRYRVVTWDSRGFGNCDIRSASGRGQFLLRFEVLHHASSFR